MTNASPVTNIAGKPEIEEGVVHIDDTLVFTFTGLSDTVPPFIRRVREDGIITLLSNRVFQAAGKTVGDLEKEIRDSYVPAYFTNLTVMICMQGDAFFIYVGGEFRSPGSYPWTNGMRLWDAIEAAGGFTDFANHRIKIIHRDGITQTLRLRGDWAVTNNPVLKQEDRIYSSRRIL